MDRVVGTARKRARRAAFVAGLAIATLVGFVLPAGANTGHVYTSQTCIKGWSVQVTLNNDVTPDRFVEVITTISGTSGIADGHYTTTKNSGAVQIWSASGPAPTSGTVTLTILNPDRSVDSTTSASLPHLDHCSPPSTTTQAPITTASTTTTNVATTNTGGQGTTTQAPATTASTITTDVATTSTEVRGDTTIGGQGSTVPMTAHGATTSPVGPQGDTATTSPSSANLPRTGTGSAFPLAFGASSLAAGALLALRRRRTWTRP